MELRTKRLLLRPYRERDIPTLARLLGAKEVAATTLRIAHPYTEHDARIFIESLQGAGTTLRAELPLSADGSATTAR